MSFQRTISSFTWPPVKSIQVYRIHDSLTPGVSVVNLKDSWSNKQTNKRAISREDSITKCQPINSRRTIWSDLKSFWSSFDAWNPSAMRKPAEVSLNWKPNAYKARDWELNPGIIGAKQVKVRCANLILCVTWPLLTHRQFVCWSLVVWQPHLHNKTHIPIVTY